jgi:cytochrome P450
LGEEYVFLTFERTSLMLNKISTLQDVGKLYTWFKEMRDTQPVWLDEESGCWHVFRYTDVNTVITDNALFSSERGRPGQASAQSAPQPQTQAAVAESGTPTRRRRGFGQSILTMDPPQHRKYRNLVSPAFTPRALGRLSARIHDITQEILDQVRPQGQVDFASDIAYPLPTIVIAEMLGVPASDRPLFKKWADGLLSQQLTDAEIIQARARAQQGQPVDESRPEAQVFTKLFEEMADYFEDMLEDRRRQPREDMMSELLASEVDGEKLSLEDTINFCILLLLAGHVTTTNLLGQSIRCFSEYPEALEQLRKQPDLMAGAVEEVLRFASPVWRTARVTKVDVTIEGVTIPAGSMVFAWLASANRDERQFPDPERFDITRTPNKHIAFGHGIHFCIGAPLSRMEASIALPMMIEQLPELQVVADQPLELFEGRTLFGFKHLPVTFKASEPVGDD